MKNVRNGALAAVFAAMVAYGFVAIMQPTSLPASQGNAWIPTTGTFSGLQAANYMNDALAAVLTCNKGPAAPTNALGGAPVAGQCWLDDSSASLLVKKRYSGSDWIVEGVIDTASGLWVPPVGGGTATVQSATTTNLCASPQSVQTVQGTTTIVGFGSGCLTGTKKTLIFESALTITYNATTMILPGQLDLAVAAGDVIEAVPLGAGNWRVTNVVKINGTAVANPSVDVGSVIWSFRADTPAKYVLGYGQALSRASYPDYVTAMTRAQAGTRSSGSNVITSVADTSKLGPGMPVEGTGIPAGATIASVTSSTITLAATCSGACNASTSGTSTVTVFVTGYGSGGSSSTIGVPDCRGRVLAGRDDMGGTAASRLTSSYFGASAAAVNVSGSSSESVTMVTANLASHNHAVFLNDPGHAHNPQGGNTNSAGGTLVPQATGSLIAMGPTTTATTGITVRDTAGGGGTANQTASTGSATPMRTVQPTLTAECFIRVLAMNEPANDDHSRSVRHFPRAIIRTT